jgi:hypothetical protein
MLLHNIDVPLDECMLSELYIVVDTTTLLSGSRVVDPDHYEKHPTNITCLVEQMMHRHKDILV